MAEVILTAAWLHDGVDLSAFVTFNRQGSDEDNGPNGDVRPYSAGRRRAVSRVGVDVDVSVQTRLADLTVVQWIRDHAGATVLYRDPAGRLMWCVYFRPHVQDEPAGFFLVRLDLVEVTV